MKKLGDIVTHNGETHTIAGHYIREKDQLNHDGRFVIAPKGIVYQIRSSVGNLYNVHESDLSLETEADLNDSQSVRPEGL